MTEFFTRRYRTAVGALLALVLTLGPIATISPAQATTNPLSTYAASTVPPGQLEYIFTSSTGSPWVSPFGSQTFNYEAECVGGGAGGGSSGTTTTGATGTAGGTTSLGALCSANGGSGGVRNNGLSTGGAGGSGGQGGGGGGGSTTGGAGGVGLDITGGGGGRAGTTGGAAGFSNGASALYPTAGSTTAPGSPNGGDFDATNYLGGIGGTLRLQLPWLNGCGDGGKGADGIVANGVAAAGAGGSGRVDKKSGTASGNQTITVGAVGAGAVAGTSGNAGIDGKAGCIRLRVWVN